MVEHRFLEVNGVRLHAAVRGRGPLLLFLHGFPENWYSWRHQLEEFGRDHLAAAPDLRGYGESDKPHGLAPYRMEELVEDVRGLVGALGGSPCVLVGHDWGGAIAWRFAQKHPGLVSKLAVLNCPHPALFRKGLSSPRQLLRSWYILFFQLPWLPELALGAFHGAAVARAFKTVRPGALTEEDLRVYRDAARRPGALSAMLAYYRNIPRAARDPGLGGRVRVPTLLLWGEQDLALGKELTYGTERYVPDLRVRYLPDCSHWTQQDRPEEVNRHLREFLAESPAPRAP